MRRILTLLLCSILFVGCARTYRSEHYSYVDAGVATDGSQQVTQHSESASRGWWGFWPCLPSKLQP